MAGPGSGSRVCSLRFIFVIIVSVYDAHVWVLSETKMACRIPWSCLMWDAVKNSRCFLWGFASNREIVEKLPVTENFTSPLGQAWHAGIWSKPV